MDRIHKGRAVALHLTIEQYDDLKARADAKNLSPANYLRYLLGYPPEFQGSRKDIMPKPLKASKTQVKPGKKLQ